MKVWIKLAKADMDIAAVQMENQYWLVSEVASLCRTKPVACADATYVYLWFSIDKTIQSAGKYTGGTFTAAVDWQTLEDDKVTTFNNFQRVTISAFKKGVTYLIPVATPAPLPMVPDFSYSIVVAGAIPSTDGEVLAQTMYRYDCDQDRDILNGTSIANCITVDHNVTVELAATDLRDTKKEMERLSYMQANGVKVAESPAMKALAQGRMA